MTEEQADTRRAVLAWVAGRLEETGPLNDLLRHGVIRATEADKELAHQVLCEARNAVLAAERHEATPAAVARILLTVGRRDFKDLLRYMADVLEDRVTAVKTVNKELYLTLFAFHVALERDIGDGDEHSPHPDVPRFRELMTMIRSFVERHGLHE